MVAAHHRSASRSEVQRPTNSATTSRATPDAALGEPAHELPLMAIASFRCGRLEAKHQHGLGIRGAHQAPAVWVGHPDTVDRHDGIMCREVAGGLRHNGELGGVVAINAQLGSRIRDRQVGEESRQTEASSRDDLEQACGGEERIIEAKPVAAEEHVPTHLPGERRLFLLHLGLDQ